MGLVVMISLHLGFVWRGVGGGLNDLARLLLLVLRLREALMIFIIMWGRPNHVGRAGIIMRIMAHDGGRHHQI